MRSDPRTEQAVLATELQGHEEAAETITRALEGEGASVGLGDLGSLSTKTYSPYPGAPPRRIPVVDPIARAPSQPSVEALVGALATSLEGAPVHVPGIGTFARGAGALTFRHAPALAARLDGKPLAPMPEDALDALLARVRGRDLAVRDLQEMLRDRRSTREPEDDILVDLPAGLPKLLRAAMARSAELGNDDRFGFVTPVRREWTWRDFASEERVSSPPDVFLLSDYPPPRTPGSREVWVLPLADLGQEDPTVIWCSGHASMATSPHRVPLTTWIQLFSLETALGPLDRGCAGKVREAVVGACPELAEMTFPRRSVGPLPDPYLQQVVLTW